MGAYPPLSPAWLSAICIGFYAPCLGWHEGQGFGGGCAEDLGLNIAPYATWPSCLIW